MASTRPGGLRGTGLLHHMAAAAAAERTMLESTRDPYRSSREDYAGSHACASAKNNPTLAADGDLCFRFIIASYCPRVHVFLPTSKVPHRFTTKKKKEKIPVPHTHAHTFLPAREEGPAAVVCGCNFFCKYAPAGGTKSGEHPCRHSVSLTLQFFLTLSCFIAIGVNLSQFICIGRFSAVSFPSPGPHEDRACSVPGISLLQQGGSESSGCPWDGPRCSWNDMVRKCIS
jgi:hypothetical protein